MGCLKQIRLTIDGNSVRDTQSCKSGNLMCDRFNPIGECDETTIGPRPKRANVRQQLHDYILAKLGAPVGPVYPVAPVLAAIPSGPVYPVYPVYPVAPVFVAVPAGPVYPVGPV